MANELADWLATRPAIVQEAARRWPLHARVVLPNGLYRVLGYTETAESDQSGDPRDLMLILTPGDPSQDYDDALNRKIRVCARHLGAVAHSDTQSPDKA